MKQSQFESRHQSDWHVFAQQLQALERGKNKPQHLDMPCTPDPTSVRRIW